jgi:hypothetical protein
MCLSVLGVSLAWGVSPAFAQPAPAKPAVTAKPAPAKPAPAKPAPAKPAPAKPAAPEPAPEPAHATPPLSESLSGDAKADYDAGKLLYVDGDFAGALVKFTAAREKSKDARLLWNIAACEKNLRHYSSVLAYVRQYLAEGAPMLSDADKDEAARLLEVIEPLTVALELSVNEPGAKVYVDDKLVGETPLEAPLTVDLGLRKLRVQKDGYEDYRDDLIVGNSAKIRLVAKLEKVVHEGTLAVSARPKDEIFVDGTLRGLGTWKGIVPSGGHTLRVTAPEMRAYQAEIVLRDKETRTVSVTLEREIKPSSGIPAWVWIGGGALLLGGATVAGYFLLKPEDKAADVPVGTLDPGTVQAAFPWGRAR